MKKRHIVIISLAFILILGVIAGIAYAPLKRWHDYNLMMQRRLSAWNTLQEKINQDVEEFGQDVGIVIEDLSTRWRISINETRLFPSASLVKVPIMASCLLASQRNTFDLNQMYVLENRNKTDGSGKLKTMQAGTQLSYDDLIKLMITESDNTATNILINSLGFDYFNQSFKSLGLKYTNLSREMMDFQSRKQGRENLTNARDMAQILEAFYDRQCITQVLDEKCMEYLKGQHLRDRIPARLPKETVVAHKTGLENGVCHDTGIVFGERGDYLICVLTKHGYKTAHLAKRFIAQVARDVYDYYQYF
jgi:beta-lactamase class A